MKQYDFVINTENVNEYKYRILTDGIDYTQYMRNPVVLYYHDLFDEKNKGKEVIGRCVKLQVKDKQLIATIEFDTEDDYAKVIAGKVERDFIRMASMYADIIESSTDPALSLPGQVYETVTKCKLIEISIVPVGGNDDALRLSKEGNTAKLQKLSINKNENMSHLKIIALAFGLDQEADEKVILAEFSKIKLAKETAEASVIQLKAKLKDIQTSEATSIVEECISLGLLPDALKDNQIKAFETDFDGQKAVLSKLISDKKAETTADQTHKGVKEVVLNGKDKGTKGTEETFDYLQKFDMVKLQNIKKDNPEQYAKLHADYENGVRHVAKV